MDDNHRLTEWLAYHYHVLPLDYLVVGVDPHSETSPSSILESWRRRHVDLTIVEWNSTTIFQGKNDQYFTVPSYDLEDYLQLQNMFLRNCLLHMKHQNRTWVVLIDPDEYLQFNGKAGELTQTDRVPRGSNHRLVVPGLPYPSIRRKACILDVLIDLERHPQPSLPLNHPVWRFLKDQGLQNRTTAYVPPCIPIPRMLFGAVESTHEDLHKMVPRRRSSLSTETADTTLVVNPNHLSTLRYRKHIRRSQAAFSTLNGWAKVMVDVSRIPYNDFPSLEDAWTSGFGRSMNAHRPIPKHCPPAYRGLKDGGAASMFRINHYVGSWEEFNSRAKDARRVKEGRNKTMWEQKALLQEETDDNIRPWLEGLVQEEGLERAQEMLSMAGYIPPNES